VRLRRISLFVLVCLVAVAVAHGRAPRAAARQTLFSDGAIQHPVDLSSEVLKALLADEQVNGQFAAMKNSEKTNPSQFFRAAEVHWGQRAEVDLVVVGVAPMAGADNTWFWIVRSARKNPRVVLFGGGSTLEVLKTKTNRYRDVSSTWSSGTEENVTTIYHFNGSNYRVWKKLAGQPGK
jgi:hypothetical protein